MLIATGETFCFVTTKNTHKIGNTSFSYSAVLWDPLYDDGGGRVILYFICH